MNIRYIKELDITKQTDAQEFAAFVNNELIERNYGNIGIISKLVDVFYDKQDVSSSLKAYVLAGVFIGKLQAKNNNKSKTLLDLASINGILESLLQLCKESKSKTFAFYGSMMTTVKNFMQTAGLKETAQLLIYSITDIFERMLSDEQIKYVSFKRIIETLSPKFQLKVKLASIMMYETLNIK